MHTDIQVWLNCNDPSATSPEWLVREIIPKWPYVFSCFQLSELYSSARYEVTNTWYNHGYTPQKLGYKPYNRG